MRSIVNVKLAVNKTNFRLKVSLIDMIANTIKRDKYKEYDELINRFTGTLLAMNIE